MKPDCVRYSTCAHTAELWGAGNLVEANKTPSRKVRHVAGRPGLRPPTRPTDSVPRSRFLRLARSPLRKVLGIAGSIIVAVATAVAIDYVSSRGDVRDALEDVSGDAPVRVHPFLPEVTILKHPWVLPDALSDRSDLHTMDQGGLRDLLGGSHAVPLGVGLVEVTIEGDRTDSVIVESIEARLVVPRAPAPTGTFISEPKFGGPLPTINLGFDLDSGDKRARLPAEDGSLGEIFGQQQYIEIKRDEKLVFMFYGVAKKPYLYRWVIDLTVQVGDRHTVVTIGEDSPYSVSGPAARYTRYYDRAEWTIAPTTSEVACPGGCVAAVNERSPFHV